MTHSPPPTPRRRLPIALAAMPLVICVLAAGCAKPAAGPAALSGPTAALNLFREAGYWDTSMDFQVYVNDQKVGTLNPGANKSFAFVPKPGGNTLKVVYEQWTGNVESEPLTFQAVAGETCGAGCHYQLAPAKLVVNKIVTGPGIATLTVSRDAGYSDTNMDFQVFVNDSKVGVSSSSTKKSFPFVIDAKENSLRLVSEGIGVVESGHLEFKVSPGETYTIYCHLETALFQPSKLIVTTSSGGPTVPPDTHVAVTPPPDPIHPTGPPTSVPGSLVVLKTNLDPIVRKVQIDSEEVDVPMGVRRTIKKSRTITHSVNLTQANTLEGTLKGGIPLISAEVRGQIQSQLGRTFEESETVEQQVEIDGSIYQKFRLTWYDKFRTGTVEFKKDGAAKTTPFEFREGTELKIEPFK